MQEEFAIASMRKRMFAFFIDDVIISIFFMIIFYGQISALIASVGSGAEMSQESLDMVNAFLSENIVIVLAIKVIYHTVLVWQNGMTMGKYFVKIKVVSLQTSQRPNFQQAFTRALIRLISDTFFYLGYAFAFFTPLKQTLHDKLTKCVVVDV